jgi:transposase InsO family protein
LPEYPVDHALQPAHQRRHAFAEGSLVLGLGGGAVELADEGRGRDREGLTRLAGKYGEHRKGTGVIDSTPELRDLVVAMITEHPGVSAKVVMRAIRARIAEELHPSYRTLQRWIAAWLERNKQLAMAIANPDGWRSRYQAAGGSRSQGIVRLNQRWESDGTKGDLILADNYRHTISGTIDVYSRRLKLHVSRTSSSSAVCSLMRRSILDWGMPEIWVTDNGADYVSRQTDRVCSGLGIERDLAPPFTPEHKPFIERAFQTFLHDLVELLPGFIGHPAQGRRGFGQAGRLPGALGALDDARSRPGRHRRQVGHDARSATADSRPGAPPGRARGRAGAGHGESRRPDHHRAGARFDGRAVPAGHADRRDGRQ